METQRIMLDRSQAIELYRDYKKCLHYSTPIDDEIRRAYQLLAQGRLIIKALESIRAAGVGADGLPKLAICRATAQSCWLYMANDGSAVMTANERMLHNSQHSFAGKIGFPSGTFRTLNRPWRQEAKVPPIPVHLRPKRGLANYHVLWEAEWAPIPPGDPYLLRRIGKSDMWLVVAMWELTEVERAVLAARIMPS